MTHEFAVETRQPTLPDDIAQLVDAVAGLPPEYRAAIEPAVDRVVQRTITRRRILAVVQETLGQLRLDMKYLMFDLEATRRERDALRQRSD